MVGLCSLTNKSYNKLKHLNCIIIEKCPYFGFTPSLTCKPQWTSLRVINVFFVTGWSVCFGAEYLFFRDVNGVLFLFNLCSLNCIPENDLWQTFVCFGGWDHSFLSWNTCIAYVDRLRVMYHLYGYLCWWRKGFYLKILFVWLHTSHILFVI